MSPTGRACLLLQQHGKFVGCVKDPNCVSEALPSLAETFVRHLPNKDSGLTALQDVLRAAMTPVDFLDLISANKRADISAVPKKLAAVQIFLKPIMHFM